MLHHTRWHLGRVVVVGILLLCGLLEFSGCNKKTENQTAENKSELFENHSTNTPSSGPRNGSTSQPQKETQSGTPINRSLDAFTNSSGCAGLAISASGSHLAVAGKDKGERATRLRVFDLKTLEKVSDVELDLAFRPNTLVLLEDPLQVLYCNFGLNRLDVETQKSETVNTQDQVSFPGRTSGHRMFLIDSGQLLVGFANDSLVGLNLETGKTEFQLSGRPTYLSAMDILDGEEKIALGGRTETKDAIVEIWNRHSKTRERVIPLNRKEFINRLDVSPDQSLMLVNISNVSKPEVWDFALGKRIGELANLDTYARDFVFLGRSPIVAVGDRDKIKIFDAKSGNLLETHRHVKRGYYINQIVLSPDKKTLVVYGGGSVTLVDVSRWASK